MSAHNKDTTPVITVDDVERMQTTASGLS